MPGIFSKLHERQITLGANSGWRFSSICRYGFIIGALGLFFSEWRVVTRNMPGYNLKYEGNMDYEFLREQDKAAAEAAAEAAAKKAAKEAAAAAN